MTYRDFDGHATRDTKILTRVRALAIPPAWMDAWICPDPNGHLQATGRDARSGKQYRYHPRWRHRRDIAKFDRILAFARILPRIREQCDRDLARPGLDRKKVLAAIVRLLEAYLDGSIPSALLEAADDASEPPAAAKSAEEAAVIEHLRQRLYLDSVRSRSRGVRTRRRTA